MEFTTTTSQQHIEQVPGVSPLARGQGRHGRQGKAPSQQPGLAAPPAQDEEAETLPPEEPSDHQIDLRV